MQGYNISSAALECECMVFEVARFRCNCEWHLKIALYISMVIVGNNGDSIWTFSSAILFSNCQWNVSMIGSYIMQSNFPNDNVGY